MSNEVTAREAIALEVGMKRGMLQAAKMVHDTTDDHVLMLQAQLIAKGGTLEQAAMADRAMVAELIIREAAKKYKDPTV